MDHMPQASPIVAWLLAYRYPIAFPLALVEGPIAMLVAGTLIRAGFFSFWPIYLLLSAGDFAGDAIWYSFGRFGGRRFIERFGRFFSITPEGVEHAEGFFKEHQAKILFLSKITMGFGFAIWTLMAAGAARVSFKKYMLINFLGQFVWSGILIGAGYFLGGLYVTIDKGLQWMFIVGLIAIGAVAIYGFGKFMRARFGDNM